MIVLVTGATGFVGSWVVRELASRGHSVRALARAQSNLRNLEGVEVEVVRGDVLHPASVARAVEGCEGLVHAAGVPHLLGGDERQKEVNVRGVEVVLSAALQAGVQRAVVTSSTAAMGGSLEPELADEASPLRAAERGIEYFASKLAGEEKALAFFERGLPVVVVRPSFVLGPGDVYRSSASLVLALARGRLPFYVEGGASFCDVRDVARGHVEALARGKPGEPYILGGTNLTITDLVRRVAQASGVAPPRRVPFGAAAVAAAIAERWSRLRGRQPRFTPQLVRSGRLYTFVSSARAERELGYAVRPFEETLRDTLSWFVAEGRLPASTPELRALAAGA
jgi:dihydroflavonol-4-reductase